MKYSKPAVLFPDQIAKLKERGLIFKNESKALHILSTISFYRLRAYTYSFQNNEDANHPFINPMTFEQIIELYKFDRKLRLIIFDATEKIEIALRTQIIYQFSIKNGSHWQTNPLLYRDMTRFDKHIQSLTEEIDRSDETFIKHYKSTYTNPSQPPCWMSLEVASMGLLSKLYQNLSDGTEKQSVANFFGLPNVTIMENWLLCFSNLRNICAHHGRLWNRRFTAKPLLPYNTADIFYTKDQIKEIYPNKFYAIASCMIYILNRIDTENTFKTQIVNAMKRCPLKQEKEMGFPEGWQNLELWK